MNTPSLEINVLCCSTPSPLVIIFVTCSLVGMNYGAIRPSLIFSLTKWQSISICLLLSWQTKLAAICISSLLSQYHLIGSFTATFSSFIIPSSHNNFVVTAAIFLYSASIKLLLTVYCFFDFQEIKEYPNFITYPVINLLVFGHATHSESQ